MSPPELRLVFAGTPDFAAAHLSALIGAGYVPLTVYTQPDRPAGRGRTLTASPVKKVALDAGLPVEQPASLKSEDAQSRLAALRPDLMIVVAYGLILPQAVLDIPRQGCLNVHASLLPRWRGAAPIQRAIEAGDPETGITIMQMDAGLDTGPMVASRSVPIEPGMTAGQLHDALARTGVPLLLEVLTDLEHALVSAHAQDDSRATYAPKIDKGEARILWQRSSEEIERQIRAFNPFPGCWTLLDDLRIKLWEAKPAAGEGAPGTLLDCDDAGIRVACGSGALCLTRLQLPGGKPLQVGEVLRSRSDLFTPGSVLH
jgi:methionyl-tRNA formyltransferase